ncbi:uncharacterized protein PHACADRAFT_258999 [Phanerochaete carnosa HHB-10118-sp]|uniref:Uncharacterized protein n=1 Tax=Phanerochaete carnosa (strain HHB-10118-sp) TaxID=650164 RepID=K5W6U3_PHACS|nr:uncharacterized protein PHACADRAFT_258999 [Phanerochaete carnosa HHB-10118-sp]EKM54850.1 hypothetical protein PHACADRAFT_258999 [Phanerochaete carnosa HHB-10118-sp]
MGLTTFPALEWLNLTSCAWNNRHAVRWKRRTHLHSLMLELIRILEFRKQRDKRSRCSRSRL